MKHEKIVSSVKETRRIPCPFNQRFGLMLRECRDRTKVIQHNRIGCMATSCISPGRACMTCITEGSEPSPVEDTISGQCRHHIENPHKRRPHLADWELKLEWVGVMQDRGPLLPEEPVVEKQTLFTAKGETGVHLRTLGLRVNPFEAMQMFLDSFDRNEKYGAIASEFGVNYSSVSEIIGLARIKPEVREFLVACKWPQTLAKLSLLAKFHPDYQMGIARELVNGSLDSPKMTYLLKDPRRRAPRRTKGWRQES